MVPRSDPFRLPRRRLHVSRYPPARRLTPDSFTWCAFIAQATIIGNSVGTDPDQGQIGIYWGQSPWLVLASAVIHVGWGYEAVRWRAALLD